MGSPGYDTHSISCRYRTGKTTARPVTALNSKALKAPMPLEASEALALVAQVELAASVVPAALEASEALEVSAVPADRASCDAYGDAGASEDAHVNSTNCHMRHTAAVALTTP